MKQFPYKFYYFGSSNSIDDDVIIEIPKEMMPSHQEDRKRLLNSILKEYDKQNWNANLVVIEDGIVKDTIYPKSWIDSVNNSLYHTYNNHLSKQIYQNPITKVVERDKVLAIYKTIRTVCAMMTRTKYRKDIKPIIKGCHHIDKKINFLKNLDFTTIENFNQAKMDDSSVWKTIAFYLAQNISLIKNNIEIYEKNEIIKNHPLLTNIINRGKIKRSDKVILNNLLYKHLYLIDSYIDNYSCNDTTLVVEISDKEYSIDMKNEITLNNI